jgi:hypothetical protein
LFDAEEAEVLEQEIFALPEGDDDAFDRLARRVGAFQKAHNPILARFGPGPLPIAAFRMARVSTVSAGQEDAVFRSSGTTDSARSAHHVHRLGVYRKSILASFDRFMQDAPSTILGHLPRYRRDSSLVHMVEILIRERGAPGSRMFLDDHEVLTAAMESGPLLLIGAAFGLLELADAGSFRLPEGSMIVETGGMKTTRASMDRGTLHDRLSSGFDVPKRRVRSEYGMCEMLSQAWALDGRCFQTPPWLRIRIMDIEDPRREAARGKSGIISVTDLANLYSASHLMTEDHGVCCEAGVHCEAGFRVLGRLSGADLRGCNFLFESQS